MIRAFRGLGMGNPFLRCSAMALYSANGWAPNSLNSLLCDGGNTSQSDLAILCKDYHKDVHRNLYDY